MQNFLKHCLRCQWARSKQVLSQNTTTKTFCHRWFDELGERISLFGRLVMRDCRSVAAQKVRRAFQLESLYRTLYGDRYLLHLLNRIGSSILHNSKVKPMNFLFAAVLFSWEKEKVSDKELDSIVDDMNEIENIEHLHLKDPEYMRSWELVIDRDHLKLWRKLLPTSTYLYEYKVFGKFYDITPQEFFHVQIDLEYRKNWDNLIINLDVVDKDEDSGTEVVHWVTHFPYPMYSRDYVYVRRYKVDEDNNMMVFSSRATEHQLCPEDKNLVRVTDFMSQMVIKPHTTFNENGLDYVLTYFDDPKSNYPSFAYNWMARTGVPSFVDRLHNAAKYRHDKAAAAEKRYHSDSSYSSSHPKQYC